MRQTSYKPHVTPLVAKVLGDEDYYGDGAPTWPGAPASSDAKATRERYSKRLRRFSPQFPKANELSHLLSACEPHHRCMSGACPECGRAFQRWFVAAVMKL
jgi:hypothetical protein